jgi:pimeloyl-ACP methyl ester carboxylesterase
MMRLRPSLSLLGLVLLSVVSAVAKPPSVTVTQIATDAGGVRLEWQASSTNLQFTVEQRSALGGGSWQPAPGTTWPSRATHFTQAAPDPSSQFYRIAFDPVPGQRGRLISARLVSTLSKAVIQFIFNTAGYPITADKDVRYYAVVYETVDAQGLPTIASGALALPVGVTSPLPLASYQHGTVVEREDVPSRLNTEGYIGVALATSGYATVLPDYLGLGDSPGFHPYHHAQSQATSVVDLLRAARAYCAANGTALSDKLFLTGYSQGGHATLAALREIESRHAEEFQVTACLAGAGAYDLSGVTLQRFLQGNPVPNPYYYPYLLAAFVDVYDVADTLGDLLQAPWKTTIPPMFNGQTSSDVINAALPPNALNALDPAVADALRSGAPNPLRAALEDNDLLDWTPKAPLRLYHCSGDQDVPPANSQVAYDRFRERGATQVQLMDPSPGEDHSGCVLPTLLATKAWFDSLR